MAINHKRPEESLVARHYVLTIAFVGISFLVRWLLDPVYGSGQPFFTFYPSIMMAVYLGGFRPALLATISSLFLAVYFIIPPRNTFMNWETYDELVAHSSAFMVGASTIIGLGAIMRKARETAVNAANDATEKQRQLEAEMDHRSKIESELRKSQERLELAQKAGGIGSFEWNVQTNEVRWTASEEEIYGLPKGAFAGKYENWRMAVHPEDREMVHQAVMQSVNTGTPLETTYRIVRPTGEVRWVRAMARVQSDATASQKVMIGVNVDITDDKNAEIALKKSEEQFRLLLEHAPAAISIGRNQRYTYVNPAFRKLFRIPDHVDLRGEPFYNQFCHSQREWVKELGRRREQGLEVPGKYEAVGLRYDGTEFPFLAQVTLITLADGPAVMAFMADISELKHTQEKLSSEAAFREAIEKAIPAGLAVVDLQGRQTYVNDYFTELVGWSRDELVGATPPYVYWPPEEYENIHQAFSRTLAGDIPKEGFELRFLKKSGKRMDVQLLISPLLNSSNQSQGYLASITDITERKLNQKALKESEESYRTLIEQSPLSIQVINSLGFLTRANKAWEQLWGVTLDQLRDFNIFTDPQLEERGIKPYLMRAFQGEFCEIPPVAFVPDRGMFKDRERWVRGVVYPVKKSSSNTIKEIVIVQEDITEQRMAEEALRESEARARALFKANIVGVCYWTVDGFITEANDAYLRTVGYTREEFHREGRINWRALTPPEYAELDNRAIQQVIERGSSDVYEKEYVQKDGSRIPILLAVALLANSRENGVAFVLDIHERKKIENELKLAQQELKAYADSLERRVEERTRSLRDSNAELEAFSYTISHDLRAPLRAMQGFSEILMTEFSRQLDDTARDYLQRIMRAASRLDILIQEVLNYSKLSKSQMVVEPVNLDEMVREIIDHYPGFREPSCKIHLTSKLPVVLAHPGSLVQCISNLLSNAIKFVKPGTKPEISIFAETLEGIVRVWVCDNGIGIDEKYHSRIFNMFERVHSSTDYQGTGVGLAIVKRAVEKMNGVMGLESQLGKGSRFWIELPLAECSQKS